MNERSVDEDKTYTLPKRIYLSEVKSKQLFGCQMVIFNENDDTEHIILYLHGGAYVNEIESLHIAFCDRLTKKTNATIYTPIYPLAPNHTFEETYKIVENLYNMIIKLDKPITIMGDSVGRGLSAAFSEYLAAKNMTEP